MFSITVQPWLIFSTGMWKYVPFSNFKLNISYHSIFLKIGITKIMQPENSGEGLKIFLVTAYTNSGNWEEKTSVEDHIE